MNVERIINGVVPRLRIPIKALEAKLIQTKTGKQCSSIKVEDSRTWKCQLLPNHRGERHRSFSGHRVWD